MKKEKFILILISTLIGFLLGYSAFFSVYYIKFDEKIKNTLVPKEKYEIILKYLDEVNHIRPEYVNSSELIYSNKSIFIKGKYFRGDSWFNQINFPTNDYAKGYHKLIFLNQLEMILNR